MTSGENFRGENFRTESFVQDQPQFYMWQAPGTVLSIYLSLQVVEELTAEYVRTNAGGLPGDIHGVLLGRSMSEPHQATYVEDFVLIPRRGIGKSGVTGSASDDELREMVCRLHRGVDAGRQAIGFFRSQSDDKLIPSRGDLKIADRLFPQPENVVLLVRFSEQGDNEAAFFYRQNGKIQRRESFHAFPFDVAKLSRRHGGRRREDNPPLEWPRPARPHVALEAPKGGIRWWQLLPTAALFTLGSIAAQTALDRKAVTPVSVSDVTASYEAPLGLKVTSLPHQLQVRWNHDSKAIRAAERGEIRIAEGDVVVTQVIPIDRQQLLNGYVAYTPLTNDVSIRFEVKTPDGRTTIESIRAVAMPGSN